MTRSLGDSSAHNVGVTHEPFTDCNSIDFGDDFIVMGSDGIFDVLSDNDVTEIMHNHICLDGKHLSQWDPQEAANLIAQAARDTWEKRNFSAIDDITCLVIKLI